jgi:hypothetical protein
VRDKIEFLARLVRYPFILLAVTVFIASNLNAFRGNKAMMGLFFGFGILWLLATAYIEVREQARMSERLSAEKSGATVRLSRYHRHEGGKMVMKFFRKHAAVVGFLVVLGAAIALYVIPTSPIKPSWGVALVFLGPIAMLIARQVERKGRDNENLIRQLQPLVGDTRVLESSIRSFIRDLLSNSGVQSELGSFGVQGWTYYIESLGVEQLSALSSLEKDLKDVDPFEEAHVIDIVVALNQILGRMLELESRLSSNLCQKINNLPTEAQSRWEYIQQTHLRLGTQLSSLRPLLSEKSRGDLFDTFVNQPPQNLKVTI